jgi:hypothetical protein
METSDLGQSANGYFARYGDVGSYFWVYAVPQAAPIPADSLTSIAKACSTCEMTTLSAGVPALLMAQAGAPNSIVWDDGQVEWDIIGPADVLSWSDALKYAADISQQQRAAETTAP